MDFYCFSSYIIQTWDNRSAGYGSASKDRVLRMIENFFKIYDRKRTENNGVEYFRKTEHMCLFAAINDVHLLHWYCLKADIDRSCIWIADPLHNNHKDYKIAAKDFGKLISTAYNKDFKWTIDYCKQIPRQTDSFNYGMHVLIYIYCMMKKITTMPLNVNILPTYCLQMKDWILRKVVDCSFPETADDFVALYKEQTTLV